MAMNKLSPKNVLVLVAGLALLAALALWATRQRAASQPAASAKPASASPSAPICDNESVNIKKVDTPSALVTNLLQCYKSDDENE